MHSHFLMNGTCQGAVAMLPGKPGANEAPQSVAAEFIAVSYRILWVLVGHKGFSDGNQVFVNIS